MNGKIAQPGLECNNCGDFINLEVDVVEYVYR